MKPSMKPLVVRRLVTPALAGLIMLLGLTSQGAAQPSDLPSVGVRGFVDAGSFVASAGDAFDAILGRTRGAILGGGAQIALRNGIYVEVAAHRFQETGERIFVHEGEVFRLGIPVRIGLQPTDVTIGYRFGPARRMVPFLGAGFGSQSYTETSDFADAGEDVRERHTSRHVAAGVDARIVAWLHVGADVRHRWVPDAIGAAGVSAVFGETDLGGTSASIRLIIGR